MCPQCACAVKVELPDPARAGRYAGQSVLTHLPQNCDMTSRLPLDARLYAPTPERPSRHQGSPS